MIEVHPFSVEEGGGLAWAWWCTGPAGRCGELHGPYASHGEAQAAAEEHALGHRTAAERYAALYRERWGRTPGAVAAR